MTAKMRIGILGAAGIAPKALVKPSRFVSEVEIVAVAARDEQRAQAFATAWDIERAYGSYEQLLEDPDVDVIYNPLPNGLHGRWTVASVAAGKHVLCEKPFAANADEARWVASQVDKSGLVVMEAFHYRYHPIFARALEIMHSGELGEIVSIDAAFCDQGPPPGDIRWSLDLAGGALMDVGCYPVHLLRSLMGDEPTVDEAHAHEQTPGVDADLDIHMTFPGGVTGTARSSMHSAERDVSALIVGTRGELAVQNPFLPQEGNSLTLTVGQTSYVEHATTETTFEFQLRALADAVLRGAPVVTDTADAIANMTVIDAGYAAAGLLPRPLTAF
ncbi:MAG: Gfo/Idh/MocA family oxidoreductase [Pseudolysinimonas sp.]